jgi:HTH-type transcriptional regulator, sugar sensing transcriptional regulator
MDLKHKEIIKALGLSDNESEVYLILLNMNEALASEIATKSRISRPHIYDTLEKLIDKGLASYVIKNNRRHYKPANPEVLIDFLKAKQNSLQEALPSLKKMYEPQKEKPIVEVYEGNEGLKNILNDVLREGKDISAWGPTSKWKDYVPIAIEKYLNERKKLGFKARMLTSKDSNILDFPLNEYKYLSKEFSSPATTFLYGNKTCMVLWLETAISILIENKELSDSFRSYFEMMWNQKLKVFRGKEALIEYFEDIIREMPHEFLVMGNSRRAAELIPEYWNNKFNKFREEHKIRSKRIYNDSLYARKQSGSFEIGELNEVCFNPAIGETPIITCIYNNKVAFIYWSKKEPFLIIIDSKELAEGFTHQFYSLWNQKQFTYNGIEGMKNALMQIVDSSPEEIYVYGTSGASVKLFPEVISEWHKRRIKNKIKTKIIYTDTQESRLRVRLLKKDPYYEVRYMPDKYRSPVGTVIYGDKVVLICLLKDGFATVIENKHIAKIYKSHFDTIWNMSKEK